MEEMIGTSALARRLRKEMVEIASTGDPVVLLGPPGSFLLSVAVAVHQWSSRRHRACVFLGVDTLSSGSLDKGGIEAAFDEASPEPEFLTTIPADWHSVSSGGTRVVVGAELLREDDLVCFGRERGRILISHCADESGIESSRWLMRCRSAGFRVVKVSPLRERGSDLAPLLDYLTASVGWSRESLSLSELELRRLEQYSWPGNVEELYGVVRYLFRRRDFASRDRIGEALRQPGRSPRADRKRWAPSLAARIRHLERREILRALEVTGWNRRRSAQMLGLSRRTLGRRMDRLGLVRLG